MAKKKYSEDVQNAYGAYASEVQSAGQDLASGMAAAGQQQIADMEAANKAYNDANNAAIEANRQRSDAAIGSFADMVEGYAQNIRNAETESAAQVAADQRAARWTGATELASSIANLIAVGGHNAVSQQYKPYSQDWMRKADMDARMNRARIDNLRERQRAMQGQLANMRMNDAARALELARADAKARYDQGLALSQARYNTTVNPLVQAGKTAEEVGKINAQGAAQAANIGLHERQLAQQAAHQQAQLDETRRYHDATLAAQAAKGSGSSSGNAYNVQFDGKNVTLHMNKETREQNIRDGKEEFLNDVMAMAGFKGTQEEFIQSVREGKIKESVTENGKTKTRTVDNPNAKYRGIVDAITNADGDEEAAKQINQFYELNRSKMNNVNRRLYTVSNSATSFGGYGGAGDTPAAGNGDTKANPTSDNSQQSGSNSVLKMLQEKRASGAETVEEPAGQANPSGTPSPSPSSAPEGEYNFDDKPQAEQGGKGTEYDKLKKNETGERQFKIDKGRYVKAATDTTMRFVNKAIEEYNATKTGNTRISETAAKLVEDEIARRLRKGDDIQDILNDNRYLPKDFGGFIPEEELEAFREVESDREGLSALEFSRKYLYPQKV